MITYEDNGAYSVIVRLEGRKVGYILSKEGLVWWYKPKNGQPGQSFNSLDAVKRSLEEY